jgi:hypothetical protein
MIKFLEKLAEVCAKNANIFAKVFGENIFQIIKSVPVGRRRHFQKPFFETKKIFSVFKLMMWRKQPFLTNF